MIHPDKEHTLALLGDWQAHHAAIDKLMGGIKDSMGLDQNGPMFDTVWKLFDAYTGTLAVEAGDFGDWLEWYFSENEMGAKCMSAGYDGDLNPVQTLDDLFALIAESRKRAGK